MRTLSMLLALCVGLAGSSAADETWLELKTPSFTVISNSGERTARRTANEFEQVRAAYGKVWPWTQKAQSTSVVVVAMKDESTFRRWAPSYFEGKGDHNWVSGTAFGADRHFLMLRTDSRPASMEVTPNYNLYRSYVGLLLSSGFGRRLPSWLWSGLGEVLGNTMVHDDEILIGRPVPWQFQRFVQNARMPLRRILVGENDPSLSRDEEARAQYDAQTYVLVHYLLFGDRGIHSSKLARFQQLWQGGSPHDKALAEAFGDLGALEGALPGYATSSILTFAVLKTETKTEGVQSSRVLPAAEVRSMQAALHVAMNRTTEAEAAILDARAKDAASPASYDAEGLLGDLARDDARALKAYVRAAELGSTSRHSYYRAAQLAWKPQLDPEALQAIQRNLERAIEQDGAYAQAHAFLAEILAELGKAEAARASAERAISLEPGRSHHRLILGRVLLSLDRSDEAREAGRLGLQLAEDAGARANAEQFLSFLEQQLRYVKAKAEIDAKNACQGGDAAACARIMPDLERSCAARDIESCLYLAWLNLHGSAVSRDSTKAAGYFQQACDAGDKQSCVEGAWVLASAEGSAKNERAAIAILQPLCDDGFPPACTRLALINVAKPTAAARARAKSLLARACTGGDAEACQMAKTLR